MKKSRCTQEQIAFALRRSEASAPIIEVRRKMGVAELRQLKQLEEENRKLKTSVADLSLEEHIFQDALNEEL